MGYNVGMKIIIDIPDNDYEKIKDGHIPFSILDVMQNGIPLEQIRAEIQENINYNKKMNYQGIVAGLLLTLDIIDNETKAK